MIQDLLGIKYPIFQGGMAKVATGTFAAAVSNSGGLGIIGAGGMTIDELEKEIALCHQLTTKPFGVNLMLMHPQAAEMADLIARSKVAVVTTGAGNPRQFLSMWKEKNIRIFPVVSSVVLAKKMESLGVDGVIAEGTESGGHVGESKETWHFRGHRSIYHAFLYGTYGNTGDPCDRARRVSVWCEIVRQL